MKITNQSSHPPGFKDEVEFFTKLVVGITGVCYALGLLTTNLYLTRFGLTDFSVLRPKSVFTGAWVLAVLLIGSSPVFVAQHKSRNKSHENSVRHAWAYLRAYLIACRIPVGRLDMVYSLDHYSLRSPCGILMAALL